MILASTLVLLGILIGSYWHFASDVIEKAVLEGVLDDDEEDDVWEISYGSYIRENVEHDVLLNPELFPERRNKKVVGSFPFKEAASAVVSIICPHNEEDDLKATGVIIDEEGLILTNRHLTGGLEEYYCNIGITNAISKEPIYDVYYADIDSEMEFGDESKVDLVVLRIVDSDGEFDLLEKFPSIPVNSWGSSDDLQIGESLYAIGYPNLGDDTISITEGIMSGRFGSDWIKVSALAGPGSSGGAVLNEKGQLVGITTMGGDEGMGYAIGTDAIKEWYSKMR